MTTEQKLREALVEAEQFIHFYKDLIKKHAIDGIHRIEPIHQNVKEALSIPPTPVDEGNEGIAQIGFDASRGLISGNLAKSKLLEALSAKDEIIKELREKLSNS